MYHLLNNVNITGVGSNPVGGPSVPLETVSIQSTITDPMSIARFDVLEQPPVLNILPQQPYVVIDETATTNPTHNFLCNGNLAHPTSTQWSVQSISGVSLTDLSPGIQFQTVNAANASFAYELQNIQTGYIIPGQTYWVTCFECITTDLSGSNAVFKFDFLDANATVITGGASDFHTTTSGTTTRISLSGVAPATAASIQVVMGVQATSGTNSGTVQFYQVMVEPAWFANEGISYPTPYCGTSAINSSDAFLRANQSGWGTASDGETWTTSGHSSTQSITSDEGVISLTGGSDTFNQLGTNITQNQVVTCRIAFSQSTDIGGVQARWTSSNSGSCYKFLYGGASNILLNRSVKGVNHTIASTSFTITTSTFYWFKLFCSGTQLFARLWADGTTEPTTWNLTGSDSNVNAGGYGVLANTNTGAGIQYDHFSAVDPGGSATYVLPDSTCIRQTRLFAGYVQTTQAQYEGTLRTWTITAASNSILIDTFYLVNQNYVNALDSSGIITSSVNANYSVSSLYPQSGNGVYTQITTNHVVAGATIDYLSVADMTFKDVLATLANSSGYYYYVDAYFDLHYAPPGYDVASFGLCGNNTQPNSAPTDGTLPTYPYYNYKYTNDGSQIKNRIKVFGGKFIAPQVTDTFVGNGSTKAFLLSHLPYNMTQVKRDGVDITSTTGLTGINTNGVGGIVALVDKAGAKITYNSAPASSGSITYTYENNAIIRTRDMASIAQYNRIFDSKINDTTLNSLLAADQRGLAELVQYSQPRGLVMLTTQQQLVAGESFQLTSNYDNLVKAPFVVQRSTQTYRGNGIYEWAIEAGAYNPDLVALLVNIHKALLRNPTQAGQTIQEEHYVVIDRVTLRDQILPSAYATAVLADAPIRYYRLSDAIGTTNPVDVGSQASNGTLHGTVTLQQAGLLTDSVDYSMLFDGSTGYMTMPTVGLPAGLSTWSVEMWFEITSHLSGFQMLWSLGNRTAGQQVDVFFNSDQTLRFELFGTATITGPIPSLSTPHQVVVTYDQTTFTLYVDGASVGTTTGGANITYGGAAIAAQASPVGNEAGCYGGEFSIYTSTLSAARVLAHYNKGVGLW